ncbi:MAG: carbon-nitrogen hydrolase family protein [candidate division Zixibacteria bacterium]|nr:carbon-nitrogen hydrolase family protein [candidate division Zixibacteria bacterium]
MAKKIKIAVYQGKHGIGVPDDIETDIRKSQPDILCLPEYFMVGPDDKSIIYSANKHNYFLSHLKGLSNRIGCAITGATLLVNESNRYKNRCYFIAKGKILGFYDKIHLYRNEGKGLVKPGCEYKVIDYRGIRIGLLICADVLFKRSFVNIRGLQPDIIVVPVTSPYIEGETREDKFARDKELFIEGARIAGCPMIKVGSIGKVAGKRVQGRSLAVNLEGILFRVQPEFEDKQILKYIDLAI